MSPPDAFVKLTVRREGATGRRWLDGLPALVDGLLARWDCRVDGPPWHGEIALVVPVTCPTGPAVLKVCSRTRGIERRQKAYASSPDAAPSA